jgi:3-methyladenine DNA glycosylase AlkD
MRGRSDDIVQFVQSSLKRMADPAKAPAMAAYMKTEQPFYGVQTPDRTPVARELKARFAPRDHREYLEGVLALWRLPHREERYLAIAHARAHREHITMQSIPLYERMVREGAWWDFVDEIAAHLVGTVLLADRSRMRGRIERWVDDKDMWIRRTALLAHLRHKNETDREQLFDHCLRRAAVKEFFIRKAIGWALREYAKTNPAAVRGFVKAHRNELSPLSVAEASKHLGG